ncbi:MAG: glutamate--tRNA ligase [Alphaproteobacteria bacterium PRO2]|nr:glutamate--tRNA ligase [Alphaproteobacteria bacterium PRO2]
MSIVTRFPPSPTGFMHIGTARTALYNWLYARRHGGKMLFRIEDTDRARHNEEAVEAIKNGLKWLELDYDGEVVSQFSRIARHAEIAHELLKKGEAYYCYCSPQELEEMRENARKEGRAVFYDRRWRDKAPSAAPKDVKPVIRIKAPLTGDSVVKDHVQGEVRVPAEQLDDFIILRSDGTPTYMLAVVVDDHDMGVNYVIRGDDHLNNTFRQNIIYTAMGWKIPEYAHLPLILGPDGAKMSKRHGAASVEEYRDLGYLPEAMRNYLLRLGWSHGDDEFISDKQAREWFDLEHIGKSPARFDFAKLENVNAHYMKEIDPARLLEIARPFYKSRHGIELDDLAVKRIMAGINELKSRAKTIVQFVDESAFYAKKIPLEYDEKARQTLQGDAKKVLEALATRLKELKSFNFSDIENISKVISQEMTGGKLGQVAMPFRAALTGTTVSPSIFHAAEILGQDETLARLQAALK